MAGSAFISYTHAEPDCETASWISSTLRSAGIRVWKDEQLQQRTGTGLNLEVANAISEAGLFLYLASGMSLASPYCQAEVAYALEHGRPFVRMDLETIPPTSVPPQILTLHAHQSVTPNLLAEPISRWPLLLVECCARQGLAVLLPQVDPIALSPHTRIIRPTYRTLKTEGQSSWRAWHLRLIDAHATVPANGYTALNLALIRSVLGQGEEAVATAELAIKALPYTPDAYYAAALAACVCQPSDRRSKPETDAILGRLKLARTQSGASQHLWLLAALVTTHFHLRRYLSPPEGPLEILQEGLSQGIPNSDECQRTWDLEGTRLHDGNCAFWNSVGTAYGFTV